MSSGLNLYIVDDDPFTCDVFRLQVERFYKLGGIYAFTDFLEAKHACMRSESGVAVFILDVFLGGGQTAFDFLDAIKVHFPMAAQDSVIVTGDASDKVVEMCLEAEVNHLLEKPVKTYALRFAVNAIASKYQRFALKLKQDPSFAQDVVQSLQDIGS